MDEQITLDYGSGGQKTADLIQSILLPAFDNPALAELGDGAVLAGGPKLIFSTDSFVVSPWEFPGGDIGKLAVCGTVNDLCMAGGEPRYLSLALILEEGFLLSDLKRIVRSIADQAKAAGVSIVTGDTKVVESGKGDGIYINTAGIGFQRAVLPGRQGFQPGDAVLVSGSIGCHGAAVMLARAGLLEAGGPLQSDCRPLHEIASAARNAAPSGIRILRDPTRGGVATTLNEFTEGTPFPSYWTRVRCPLIPPCSRPATFWAWTRSTVPVRGACWPSATLPAPMLFWPPSAGHRAANRRRGSVRSPVKCPAMCCSRPPLAASASCPSCPACSCRASAEPWRQKSGRLSTRDRKTSAFSIILILL